MGCGHLFFNAAPPKGPWAGDLRDESDNNNVHTKGQGCPRPGPGARLNVMIVGVGAASTL